MGREESISTAVRSDICRWNEGFSSSDTGRIRVSKVVRMKRNVIERDVNRKTRTHAIRLVVAL